MLVLFRSSKAFNLPNVAADVDEEPEVLESVEVSKDVLHIILQYCVYLTIILFLEPEWALSQ